MLRTLSVSLALMMFWLSTSVLMVRRGPSVDHAVSSSQWVKDFNAPIFRALSFGQAPSVVDFFWLRLLQDEEYKISPKKGDLSAKLLQLIVDIDPAYYMGYIYGPVLLSVLKDQPQEAEILSEKGEHFRIEELPHYSAQFRKRFWPQEWYLPLRQAYVRLFELDDIQGAAESYRKAAAMEGVLSYVPALAKKLDTVEGQFAVGLQILDFTIKGSHDEAVIEKIQQRKEILLWKRDLYELNRDFAALKPAQRKDWMNYVLNRGFAKTDPRGGDLFLNAQGKISSPMDRDFKVMGY